MTTATQLVATLTTLGVAAFVDWDCGSEAKVLVGGTLTSRRGAVGWLHTPVAYVVIDHGRAFVPTSVQTQFGHGLTRLSSHPAYPAPTESAFITTLIKACEIANKGAA